MGGSAQQRFASRPLLSVLTVLGVVGGTVLAIPATAAAARAAPMVDPATSLIANITSTYDSAYAEGEQGAWDAGNANTGANVLTTQHLWVGAVNGRWAKSFSLDLFPPAGQALHAGYYANVQSGWGNQPGHANASLTYGVEGAVESFDGDVEIRDLAADATGQVTRFDLFFHMLSRQATYNLSGEIRLGEPEPAGHILSAHAVDWSKLPIGSPPLWTLESLDNTSDQPETIGRAALVGGTAADFRLADDTCSGTRLAAGDSCTVRVGFSPRHAGPRASALVIPIDGVADQVQLTGSAPAGVSSLVTWGHDYVDRNRTWRYIDGPDQLTTRYDRNRNLLAFGATRLYDFSFDNEGLVLTAPTGHTFTRGIHLTSDAYSTTKYGLSVSGHGRGCGSYSGKVNIKYLVLGTDGAPLRADIAISQQCNEQPGERMSGELKWRAGPDATPPGPVTGLHVNAAHVVAWTNPRAKDFSYTRLRLTSALANPRSVASVGYVVYLGHGRSVHLAALRAHQRYTLSAVAVDTRGNVGTATRVTVTG